MGKATCAGFPHPTVLHLQAFSASWRFVPSTPSWLCFTPEPSRLRSSECSLVIAATISRCCLPLLPFTFASENASAGLQGFMHSLGTYRLGRCYPMSSGRSSLDLRPSEVSLAWPRHPKASPLMGFSLLRVPTEVVSFSILALQSFKEPRGVETLSSPCPSVGFSVRDPQPKPRRPWTPSGNAHVR